jgi:hypothetical protein
MAAFFSGLLPSGTNTVQATPCCRDARAIDWPWFPVLAVTMPRARSSAGSDPTRFTPPRTLKAPVGLWFSCFTQRSSPVSASSSACFISGEAGTCRDTRSRAA